LREMSREDGWEVVMVLLDSVSKIKLYFCNIVCCSIRRCSSFH
jgi:hypothetical protein